MSITAFRIPNIDSLLETSLHKLVGEVINCSAPPPLHLPPNKDTNIANQHPPEMTVSRPISKLKTVPQGIQGSGIDPPLFWPKSQTLQFFWFCRSGATNPSTATFLRGEPWVSLKERRFGSGSKQKDKLKCKTVSVVTPHWHVAS